jgi:ABC-2 type transport system permease protein
MGLVAVIQPDAMQKVCLLSINAWAIDGFTKVSWRDEPVAQLWPQVLALLAIGVVLFAVAPKIAQRWECA